MDSWGIGWRICNVLRAMEHNNDGQIQSLPNIMDLFFSLIVPDYANTGNDSWLPNGL